MEEAAPTVPVGEMTLLQPDILAPSFLDIYLPGQSLHTQTVSRSSSLVPPNLHQLIRFVRRPRSRVFVSSQVETGLVYMLEEGE